MKTKFLQRVLWLMIPLLTIFTTNAWGATTYKLTQVTSASGLNTTDKYVFEQGGYVMNNSITSSALVSTNSYSATGLSGSESYIWKLASATTGYKMQCLGKSGNNYLANSSSTSVSWTTSGSASDWSITFTDGIAKITNNSNSGRFLGWTNNSTSHNYKAYATNNTCNTYPCSITVYKLEEESDCDVPTSPSNGATTHATTGANGSQAVSWSGGTANYEIYYHQSSTAPTTQVSRDNISTTSTTISGLTAGQYWWWVRSDCGSDWVAGSSFTINGIKTGGTIPVNFGTVLQNSVVADKTITATGYGLSSSIVPSFPSGSPFSASVSGTTVTISANTATVGSYDQNMTLTSGNYSVTVNVKMVVEQSHTVTWKNNGGTYETTIVKHNEKPTFPNDPTSCDAGEGASTTLYGWAADGSTWTGKINDISAKTIYTSASAMPNVTADVTYHAVFAKASGGGSSTLFSEDFASITSGNSTSTSGSGTSWTKNDNFYSVSNAYQAGGAVRIGTGSAVGYLVTKQLTAAVGTEITIAFKVKGWSTVEGNIQVSGNNSEFTQPSATTYTATIDGSFQSKSVTVTLTSANPKIKIATTAKRAFIDDIVITIPGSVTYSNYMTHCCDKLITIGTPTKTGSGTVTFASGGDAVAVGSDVPTCAGATTITATVTPSLGYSCTALSFSGGSVSVSPTIPDPFVPYTSATVYTLSFDQNTNATLATTVTFTQLQDKYYDYMHGNATITKSGNYGTAPTLNSVTKADGCAGEHYKFIGWIPESDMNMSTGVPTTTANMVAGGATGKSATNTTYYAIWAEEVTP